MPVRSRSQNARQTSWESGIKWYDISAQNSGYKNRSGVALCVPLVNLNYEKPLNPLFRSLVCRNGTFGNWFSTLNAGGD